MENFLSGVIVGVFVVPILTEVLRWLTARAFQKRMNKIFDGIDARHTRSEGLVMMDLAAVVAAAEKKPFTGPGEILGERKLLN